MVARRFSANLRRLMADRDLSQSDLARAIPTVSQPAISQWLLGRNIPLADAVVALARFFRVSTDELLGGRRR